MSGVPRHLETKTGRLLRVLLVRGQALPAGAGRDTVSRLGAGQTLLIGKGNGGGNGGSIESQRMRVIGHSHTHTRVRGRGHWPARPPRRICRSSAAGQLGENVAEDILERVPAPAASSEASRPSRMTGTITQLQRDRGTGSLVGEDGTIYTFRRRDVRDGWFHDLLEGETVTFDAGKPPRQLEATLVRRVRHR